MRNGIVRIWFATFIVLAGVVLSATVHAKPKDYPHSDGEVIVKFRPTASNADRQSILADLGALDVRDLPPSHAKKARIGRLTVEAAIEKYKNHPKIQYIEPNYIVHIARVPNDPAFGNLWGLQNLGQTGGTPGADIRATNAWDLTTGSASVLVAIIDTGIDYTHPDLAANIFSNTAEVNGFPGVDDDANGFVDDTHGWDFSNHDNDPFDDHSHGTHVSGTVGGVGDNGIGVVGVNWTVKLLPVKFLNAGGSGTTTDAIDAINYATLMHANIMNNSWGGGGFSQALLDAITAANDAGIIFVAAAGNFSSDNDAFPFYPATYDAPNVISVAATDHNDGIAGFSNFGLTTVDLGAPGVDVYSTLPGNSYGTFSGTSMACPHVVGACALVLSRFPGMAPTAVKNLIMRFAHPIPALTGRCVTGGRLDAFMPLAEPDSIPPGGITDLAVTTVQGSRVNLQWTASGDDGGVGRASRYEVRYSTSPITQANFDAAPLAPGAPNPDSAGVVQTMEVRGLTFDTGYFFAIVAFDEFDNRGPLSNVPFAATLQGPDIDVSPLSMSESLLTGQTATQLLTIRNTGVSELNFDITIRGTSPGAVGARPAIVRTGPPRPRIDEPRVVDLPAFRTGNYAAPRLGNRASEESVRPRVLASLPPGTLRILLVASGGDVSDIQSRLVTFPDIAAVDVFQAGAGTPLLSELLAYDAAIVTNNQAFADGNALGNVLADYADAGGGVIVTLAAIVSGFHIGGRFLAEGYSPFELGFGPVGFATLGARDSLHPIMAGVVDAGGDLLSVNSLSAGSELVASWSTGQPFIGTKNGNVAAVNIFLPFGGYWTGDIPLILHNAVLWSSHNANWASASPDAGVVPAGSSLTVSVTFDANDLDGGDYTSTLEVRSDDPDESTVPVALSLHVTGAPNIVVTGEAVEVTSSQDYFTDGASTTHSLASNVVPGAGGGSLELIADGDFGFGPEVATLTVEGVLLGSTTTTGTDCSPARKKFPLDAAQLTTFLADGHVDCQVQNDIEVNVFCSVNRHTVRLSYSGPADVLAFGSPFVGGHRDVAIVIRNTGTDELVVSEISSNQPQFVPDASSMAIPPRSLRVLTIRFAPPTAAPFSGTLHIASNDADSPSIDISMNGIGLDPPIAAVEPTSLAITLNEGETAHQTLHLANLGLSPLNFTIDVRAHADSTVVSSFAGLGGELTAVSNNATAHANAGTNGLRDGEPTFRALTEEFEALPPSPVPLTCVVEDRSAGFLYGQGNFSSAFFRYAAAARSWQSLPPSAITSGNNGGAALLAGKVYTTYVDYTVMGVYDIATNSWTVQSLPLPFGTCNIASDGFQYLYLVVAQTFVRLDPATGAITPLATPPFYYEPWGGMRISGNTIYAHQGNGTQGFAKYEISTGAWTILPPVPGGAVAGAAIDPLTNDYLTYGSYGGRNLYRYSIPNVSWSVATIPLFTVSDGGLGFLPSAGLLFVQGEGGTGFGRVGTGHEPVTVTPISGSVPAGASADLDVLFDSNNLFGGVYPMDVHISSNDPVTPTIDVPATLTVIGVPNLQVAGELVELSSTQSYTGSGASTTHRLDVTRSPAEGGTMSILADGDYGDPGEEATVSAEGMVLGTTLSTGTDCLPAAATFPLDATQLGTLLADGHVDVMVQNSVFVDDFCSSNRHTITLRYRAPVGPIDFGTLFVGTSREITLSIQNLGSSPLDCVFSRDVPEFTLSAASFTVPPRDVRPLTIHFAPGSPTTFEGLLHIVSNDPDTPTLDVTLRGIGVLPPIVGASPESLAVVLNEGDGTTRTVTISNSGPSPLEFTLQVLPSLSSAAVRSPFQGVSQGLPLVSNNPPRAPEATTDGAGRTTEPRFHAAAADFELLAPSPVPLTCFAADPTTGAIYGQANFGNAFYRYDAASNAWFTLNSSPIFSGNNGGAAYLNGRIYTSYTQYPYQLGVYNIAGNTWTVLPVGSSYGTGNIASDGSQYLYLVSSNEFIRIDPETLSVSFLPPPPFPFSPWGGLQIRNNVLYGHVGNGSSSFAQFDLRTGSWSALAVMPGPAVLGSTYDPNANEYIAYGGYGGNNLYRFDVGSSSWTVNTVPFFSLNDGGIAWIGGSNQGIYFVQGESGTGFARTSAGAGFLTLSSSSGTVPPFGSVPIDARFETGTLGDGTYRARIGIFSNDPVRPQLDVPASMRVIGAPNLSVEGEAIEVESAVSYFTDGAATNHDLATPAAPGPGGGTLSLTAEGDYGDFGETATLSAEGTVIGSVGMVGFDCTPASGSFPLTPAQLAALMADGHVQVQVQNTFDVNVFCPTNQHTVRLAYRGPAGPLDFGSLFLGATRTITLTARNLGSVPLVISSITSDRSVFNVTPSSLTVPPRSSETFQVRFAPVAVGGVSGTVTVNSNDGDQPSIAIAVSGIGLIPPVASVTPASFLESLYPGGMLDRTLTIRNTGGSDLDWAVEVQVTSGAQVESSSPAFTGAASRAPSKTVGAPSGRPAESELYSSPVTKRISDPAGGPSDPTTDVTGAPLGLAPKGTMAAESSVPAAVDPALEEILAELDANYGDVTSIIPNRFDFSEGDFGFSIGDGGFDMYDGGNYLSTSLGGFLSYTNGPISASPFLGSGGRYFTKKYPGLFVFAADIRSISDFVISGNLGADGGGITEGAVFTTHVSGREFVAFSKRTYNAGDPSVNHLIILENRPELWHQFALNTDDDYHVARSLDSSTRLYYMLYASQSGGYIDNTHTIAILDAFLSGIGLAPAWLTVSADSGRTAAGATSPLGLHFDATDLEVGDHFARVQISTNDPLHLLIPVPVQLHVVGRPVLSLGSSSLDFGTVFVGYSSTLGVMVSNPGSEPLMVSGITPNRSDYTVAPSSFTLASHESTVVQVRFAPAAAGSRDAIATIVSNDPDSPHTLGLVGSGLVPPVISLTGGPIETTVVPGGQRTKTLRICNTGGSDLAFSIRAVQAPTSPTTPASASATSAADLALANGGGLGTSAASPAESPAARHASSDAGGTTPRIDGAGGPDTFGYTWRDSDDPTGPAFGWIDIRSSGTLVPFSSFADDENLGPIPIGFVFPFYGTPFTTFNVSTNGFISFTSRSTRSVNIPFPNAGPTVPENVIAPLWDDLLFAAYNASKIYYHSDGTRLVVQFVRGIRFGDSGGFYDFEIVLYPNGRIVCQYLTLGTTRNSATVGIQNASRDDGLTVVHNAGYLHSNLAIEIAGAPSWLTVSPASDVISAGGCLDVNVEFDAADLALGTYDGLLRIATNDPAHPTSIVAVTLHVVDPVVADVSFTPRTLNASSNGRWVKARLDPRSPYDAADVVVSSVRLNGVLVPDLATSGLVSPDELGGSHIKLQFDRGQVASLLPAGDSIDVVLTGDFTDDRSFVAHDNIRVIHPRVTSPNGGEVLHAGASYTVSWTVPAEFTPGYADILWSSDGGATWTVARSQVTGTSASWTVPNVPTTTGRVRVQLYDLEGLMGLDASDANFAITGAVASLTEGQAAIRVFAVRQNSPNPFSHDTAIEFDLPRETPVRCTVFDMAGRSVRVLANGLWPVGRHQVRWNGQDDGGRALPPGIYLYRFEAGSFVATRRMVLIE